MCFFGDVEVVKVRGFRVDTDGLESLLMKETAVKASQLNCSLVFKQGFWVLSEVSRLQQGFSACWVLSEVLRLQLQPFQRRTYPVLFS